LKHEIGWESMSISLDRFIETECGNAVERRQIAIEYDFLTADFADQVVNSLIWDR
jgi:hypothetical protein